MHRLPNRMAKKYYWKFNMNTLITCGFGLLGREIDMVNSIQIIQNTENKQKFSINTVGDIKYV